MDSQDFQKEDLISLQNATSLCRYSQEYLSLRARQGKLRATKQGRKWMTTKAWLDQYTASIAGSEEEESQAEEKIEKQIVETPKEEPIKEQVPTLQLSRELPPPMNLPIEDTRSRLSLAPMHSGQTLKTLTVLSLVCLLFSTTISVQAFSAYQGLAYAQGAFDRIGMKDQLKHLDYAYWNGWEHIVALENAFANGFTQGLDTQIAQSGIREETRYMLAQAISGIERTPEAVANESKITRKFYGNIVKRSTSSIRQKTSRLREATRIGFEYLFAPQEKP